ncbi:hypothetical protein GCM10027421_36300 [Microbacterium shaanxiense]
MGPVKPRNQSTHWWAVGLYVALLAGGGIIVVPQLVDGTVGTTGAWLVWVGGAIQSGLLFGISFLALPRSRTSASLRTLAALGGGLIALAAGIIVNQGSSVVAPFAEEVLKLGVVGLVVWVGWRNDPGPLQGLVLGFFVGFGFEIIEDVIYGLNALIQGGEGNAFASLSVRTFVGFGLHNMLTAVSGCALVGALRRGGRAWLAVVVALPVTISLHWAWDNLLSTVPWLLVYAAAIGVFIVARLIATRSEQNRNLGTVRVEDDGLPTSP